MKLKNRENLYFDNHIYTQNCKIHWGKFIKWNEKKRGRLNTEVEEKRKKTRTKKKKSWNSPLCSVKIFDAIILASFGTLGFVRIDLIDAPAPNVEPPVRSLTCCAPMSATLRLRQTQHSFKNALLVAGKGERNFFYNSFGNCLSLNFY